MARFLPIIRLASESPRGRMARGALRVVLLALLALCLLGQFGCFPTYRRLARGAYQGWYKKNRSKYERLKLEARKRGWVMYVWKGNGIGRLDLGRASYEPLYTAVTGKRIWAVSQHKSGRIGFIECDQRSVGRNNVRRSNFELRVLSEDGRLRVAPLGRAFGEDSFPGIVPGEGFPASIVLGERSVLFASEAGMAYLYDLESGELREVLGRSSPLTVSGLYKVLLLEGRFLIVLTGHWWSRASPHYGVRSDMVVLDGEEPFDMLRTLDGVTEAVLVDEKVVIQRGTDCFLYDPVDGSQVRLASGSLVAGLGIEDFLFCKLRGGSIRGSQGSLHKYSLTQRSAELIWDTGPTEFCGFPQIFPSPESLFLFIPLQWNSPPVMARVYVLFSLDSHEAVGQLFSPFEGKDHIHFLGWADGEDVEAPENEKLE